MYKIDWLIANRSLKNRKFVTKTSSFSHLWSPKRLKTSHYSGSSSIWQPTPPRPMAAFWGDSDGDGVYNGLDCAPYNRFKQGPQHRLLKPYADERFLGKKNKKGEWIRSKTFLGDIDKFKKAHIKELAKETLLEKYKGKENKLKPHTPDFYEKREKKIIKEIAPKISSQINEDLLYYGNPSSETFKKFTAWHNERKARKILLRDQRILEKEQGITRSNDMLETTAEMKLYEKGAKIKPYAIKDDEDDEDFVEEIPKRRKSIIQDDEEVAELYPDKEYDEDDDN